MGGAGERLGVGHGPIPAPHKSANLHTDMYEHLSLTDKWQR